MKTVTQEIDGIYQNKKKNKKTLYPEDVVQYARRYKESALHCCLEWDDHLAAEEYRKIQARKLIEGIRVDIVTSTDGVIRGCQKFIELPSEGIPHIG
jgi:hypothetical protein